MKLEPFDILKSHKLFTTLTQAQLKTISKDLEVITINAGETLFNQGEPSDSMYLLVHGRLCALLRNIVGDEAYIGDIQAGQTIGELGLITEQSRSLTVQAVRNSTLLKLKRESFLKHIDIFSTDPTILNAINTLIITRSRETLRIMEKTKPHTNIALLPANQHASLSTFLELIQQHLPQNYSIAFVNVKKYIENNTPEEKIKEELDHLEKVHQHVIYLLSSEYNKYNEILLDFTDKIMVLAPGNTKLLLHSQASETLEKNSPHHQVRKTLLFLHDNNDPHQYSRLWLDQNHYTHHHHLHINRPADLEQFWRFITGNAIGLVLSGGGNKGWMYVGAMKALYELGIKIDAIGGTSVGAIAGACYNLCNNYNDFHAYYTKIMNAVKNPYRISNITVPVISLLSGKKGTLAIKQIFSDYQMEELNTFYFCISSNISKRKEMVNKIGPLWLYTRASSSLPALVPPVVIDGDIHVDGVMLNNLPVDVMNDLFDGMIKIIAINLSPLSDDPNTYHFPPTFNFWDGLLYKLGIKKDQYRFPSLYHTFFASMLVGTSEKIRQNAKMATILIHPTRKKFSTLASVHNVDEMIQVGYEMTIEKLAGKISQQPLRTKS